MKNQNIGFGFLLLGLIFAVRQDIVAWVGIILGMIGLIIIIENNKQEG